MQTSFSLNSFQQMMLQWTQFTPYNAGHVILLLGNPNVSRWEKVILQAIQDIKIGKPHFSNQDRLVQFQAITSFQIEIVQGDLDSHINHELNRPFSKNDFPLRFFILCGSDQNYYLGAIYNHWISDSVGMRALFQRICESYQAGNTVLPALTFEAPSFRQVFRSYIGKFSWWNGIKEFVRCLLHFQSVYRMKMQNVMNFHTGFNRYELPDGLISRLSVYAKKQGVSMNDVFLSALAKVMGEYTQQERNNIKRKKLRFFARNRLALGTIVDIRQPVQEKLNHVFGQYLSNYTVVLKKPEENSFAQLLKNIHSQTHEIKKSFRTIKNFASWDVSLFVWKLLSSQKSQARFFTKHAPVVAGLSNVNLTHSWIGEKKDVLDYLRISPTGLLLPLVFTLTTIHQKLSLCVSYRTTAFKPEEVDLLSKSFMKVLEESVQQ